MLEELSVRYHTCFLPALLLPVDIIIPEAIVVVVEVARNAWLVLDSLGCLNFVDGGIGLEDVVGHDLFGRCFELVLVDVLLLAKDLLTLLHSVVIVSTTDELFNQLACIDCLLRLVIEPSRQQVNEVLLSSCIVVRCVTKGCCIELVELLLLHHLFACLDIDPEFLGCGDFYNYISESTLDWSKV